MHKSDQICLAMQEPSTHDIRGDAETSHIGLDADLGHY